MKTAALLFLIEGAQIAHNVPQVFSIDHPQPVLSSKFTIEYSCNDGDRKVVWKNNLSEQDPVVILERNGIKASKAIIDKLNRLLADRFDGISTVSPSCHSLSDHLLIEGYKERTRKQAEIIWSPLSITPDPDIIAFPFGE